MMWVLPPVGGRILLFDGVFCLVLYIVDVMGRIISSCFRWVNDDLRNIIMLLLVTVMG